VEERGSNQKTCWERVVDISWNNKLLFNEVQTSYKAFWHLTLFNSLISFIGFNNNLSYFGIDLAYTQGIHLNKVWYLKLFM